MSDIMSHCCFGASRAAGLRSVGLSDIQISEWETLGRPLSSIAKCPSLPFSFALKHSSI
jgi:hypothetical protein